MTGGRPRAGLGAWRRLLPLVAVGLLLGCAQIEAPKGGPEDREPPRVIATWPESAAVRVPWTDSIALVFSEPVDRNSVEDAFFLSPPVRIRDRRWKSRTWILELADSLPAGVTYTGLLGVQATDRHGIALKEPWSFAFSTGDSLDDGEVAGKVVGQRYPGKQSFLFVWPWDAPAPDTTSEGLPADPLRLGQAGGDGAYVLSHLPRGRELRICALFDRDGNREFDPGSDRWTCLELPLVLGDTGSVRGVDLYCADRDEPGTVSGTVIDSACVRSDALARLRRVRTEQDSLRGWLAARADTALLTLEDSLRIGGELNRLDSLRAVVAAESAHCATPLLAQLTSGDTLVVRESKGNAFQWKDVPAGLYRLRGFRDLNANGRPDSSEAFGRWPQAIEVLPLRVLHDLDLQLPDSGKFRP